MLKRAAQRLSCQACSVAFVQLRSLKTCAKTFTGITTSQHSRWGSASAALLAGVGATCLGFAASSAGPVEAETAVVVHRPSPGGPGQDGVLYRDEHGEWDAVVDFIVVGAGSAGCAVAARLCEGLPHAKTLLLEAGSHDDLPEIQTAVDYFGKVDKVFGSDRDWIYASEPQEELGGRALYWPRGKVLGGCSSFNTMVWMRGDPGDFDAWARLLGDGFQGWGAAGMWQHFKNAESHPYAAERAGEGQHGGGGPITVAPLDHAWHHPDNASHPVTRTFVQASQAVGFKANDDFGASTEGVGMNHVNAKAGQRCSTSAYLKRVGAYPRAGGQMATQSTNGALSVWLHAHTLRLCFDRAATRATGAIVRLGKGTAEEREVRVRARREVVVCGGAVNSPQLLLLSGVGARAPLEELGIAVVRDLPGVGANLKDHLHLPMCYRVPGGVRPHSHSNICEGSLFARLQPSADRPDLQVHCGVIFFEPDGFSPLGEGFTLTPSLIHPRSVGAITLASADPDDKPVIRPNYLSDPEGYDLEQLMQGVELVREVGHKMLELLGGGAEEHPGPGVRTRADTERYVRRFVGTMYHPTSTCRMGRAEDSSAVVDARLRVHGLQGLRVADASIMPEIVGANTNATCVAIGEKAAAMIVEDHR